jgi:phage terminase large subunit-like protein
MSAVMERPAETILSRGPQVIQWIERNCVHTKGKWSRQPFRMMAWQKRYITQLFEIDADTGRRKIRESYLRIPKKNGKSELVAAIACFCAQADTEPAPEVYVAANSDEQADLVFGAAKFMCENSPTLTRVTQCYAKEIHFRRSDQTVGKIRRLSATVGTNDGLNVSHAIFDELHEFTATKGAAMYDVVTNGTAAREQPLIMEISTAGFDEESLEYRKYEYGKRVNAGEIDDPTFLFVNFEAPASADYRDLDAWAVANPSWGITVHESYAEDQIRKKSEGIIRRYNLNQQTETEDLWLPAGSWDACRADVAFDPNLPVVAGWDAARRRDATAVVALQRKDGRVLSQAFIWERPINPANGQPVEDWKTPTGEVMALIRDLHSTYDVRVGYDAWGIKESVETLESEGVVMVEVPQTNARMIPATEYLYELIVNETFAHDGDATYARHMRNAVTRVTPSGVRVDKMKTRKPQDACIATIIAASELLQESPEEETPLGFWDMDGDE